MAAHGEGLWKYMESLACATFPFSRLLHFCHVSSLLLISCLISGESQKIQAASKSAEYTASSVTLIKSEGTMTAFNRAAMHELLSHAHNDDNDNEGIRMIMTMTVMTITIMTMMTHMMVADE